MIASLHEIRICFDRLSPDTQSVGAGAQRLSLLKAKKWAPGTTLRIGFAGGTAEQKRNAQVAAEAIMQYANIDFRFNNPPTAIKDIRCTFDPRDGAWSYLGTDITNIPKNQATMNLGFENDPRTAQTAKHEFCHSLAAVHEHSVEGGIKWNKEAVYREYSGPPNNWTRDQIDSNVLETYSRKILNGTEFDPLSIMAYPVDPALTLDVRGIGFNADFSELDKRWLRDQYPGRDPGPGPITPVFDYNLDVVDLSPNKQSISKPGERDLARLTIKQSGRYVIEAQSRGDRKVAVVLTLFGPNSTSTMVAQTNNAQTQFDARLDLMLMPGEYAVQVSNADLQGIGDYGLVCLYVPQDSGLLDLPKGEITIGYQGVLLPGRYSFVRQG